MIADSFKEQKSLGKLVYINCRFLSVRSVNSYRVVPCVYNLDFLVQFKSLSLNFFRLV